MRLRERGYQTAGFSENPVVSEAFGLSRGFDHFESRSIASVSGDTPFGIEKRLRAWLAGRDVQKPFFVMLNLMDAHDPYSVRESNAYLPDATTRAQALESTARFEFGICDALPPPRHIAILRGLYLGDVNAADRKLGSLHRATAAASRFGLVSVVTSDHGEHFGERRLLNHQFSVADPLLRIPLIVHGLPGRPGGGVVAEPVTLVDVTASVLSWSGAEVPAGLDGVPLPMPGDPPLERTLFGFYADWRGVAPDHWPEGVPPLWAPGLGGTPTVRSDCGPADAVFGDMAAVFEGPLKLIAFEDRPSELYDLSWDAAERSDQAPHEPELVSRLEARLEALKRGPRAVAAPTLGAEASEALRALGYLD
jgi:arylsulfatase A-like enzyme